jgi:hypothetical protein
MFLMKFISIFILICYGVTDVSAIGMHSSALRPLSTGVFSDTTQSAVIRKGLYARYVTIEGAGPYKLDISYNDIDKNGWLYNIWSAKAKQKKKPYLYTQQIGIKKNTFIGIAADNRAEAEIFLENAIHETFIWRALLKKDLFFVINDKSRVNAFSGKALKFDKLISRIATKILEEANNGKKVMPVNGYNSFMKTRIIGTDKTLVIQGAIDSRDCKDLIETLRSDYGHLLKRLGHTTITLVDRSIVINTQNNDEYAKETIRRVVNNITTVISFSDIHAATKGYEDTFGEEKEKSLIKVIEYAAEKGAKVEINGDLLELWMEKYGNIIRAYDSGLFNALRKVRRVIYVAGNHDWIIVSHFLRQEMLRIAKANVIKDKRKKQLLSKLVNHDCVAHKREKLLKGAKPPKFILSRGFRERGLLRDDNTFYIDEIFIDWLETVKPEKLAGHIYRSIEDLDEDLFDKIEQDIPGIEIMRHYEDEYLKVDFEHGHFSDPYSYQSATGFIATWIVTRLAKLGIKWPLHDAENRLMYMAMAFTAKFYPPIMLNIVVNYGERVLAKAGIRHQKGKYIQGKKWIILFGHSHFPSFIGNGHVNDILDYFYGMLYGNTGAWTKRREKRREGLIKQEIAMDWYEISADGIRLRHGAPEDGQDIEFVSEPINNPVTSDLKLDLSSRDKAVITIDNSCADMPLPIPAHIYSKKEVLFNAAA